MNFERITKNENWLVKTNYGYYCTHCNQTHHGSHRANKRRQKDPVLWQCPSCKMYYPFKSSMMTNVGWKRYNSLRTVSHVAKMTTTRHTIRILYYRVEKHYDGKMHVTATPIMRDTLENGNYYWKREIKGIRGDMYHPYRVVEDEEWRKSTRGLQNISVDNLYLGYCDLSKNDRYKHIMFRKYFDAVWNGGSMDMRQIGTFDYRDELLVKHGNYHVLGYSFDWKIYMAYHKHIKKHEIASDKIQLLKYTQDYELIDMVPDAGHRHMLEQCNHERLKTYLMKTTDRRMYGDYIDMVMQVYGTLKKRKYPKDLKAAHDTMVEKVSLIKNMYHDVPIRNRAKELAGMVWKNEIYIIQPIQNVDDLTVQGKELNHCITSERYASRYASGKMALFKVTRISDDKRIATLELVNNEIQQARIVNNQDLPQDLQNVIQKYEKEVLA